MTEPPPSYEKKKFPKLILENTRNNTKKHSYDNWVKFREKVQETNIQHAVLIRENAELFRKLLPTDILQRQVSPKIDPSIIGKQNPRQVEKDTLLVFPSPSSTGENI